MEDTDTIADIHIPTRMEGMDADMDAPRTSMAETELDTPADADHEKSKVRYPLAQRMSEATTLTGADSLMSTPPQSTRPEISPEHRRAARKGVKDAKRGARKSSLGYRQATVSSTKPTMDFSKGEVWGVSPTVGVYVAEGAEETAMRRVAQNGLEEIHYTDIPDTPIDMITKYPRYYRIRGADTNAPPDGDALQVLHTGPDGYIQAAGAPP